MQLLRPATAVNAPVPISAPTPILGEDFATFERFVQFFCRQFKDPGLFATAACRPSQRDYVRPYYDTLFVRPEGISARHLKWFRRLQPLLASLPKGATILDYGGGFGLDSIFLAACGYQVVFYEISPDHIGICRHLAGLWQQEMSPLDLRCVLAGEEAVALPQVDAVLLNEVAHHIEPPAALFDDCARLLRPGGRLYLLEPNSLNMLTQIFFLRVRGLRTVQTRIDEHTGQSILYGNENIRSRRSWNRLARRAGFIPQRWHAVIPYLMHSTASSQAPLRRRLEAMPLARELLASHITHEYLRAASP